MTTAFVLPAAGALGAVQVGMLRARVDREVRPHLLVGLSVALNAAFVAGPEVSAETVVELERIWRSVRRARQPKHLPRPALGARHVHP